MVHSKSQASLLSVWKLHEGPWGSASPAVPPQGHQVWGLGDDQVSGFLCYLPEVSGAHLNITWGSLCSVVLIPCAQLHVLLPEPRRGWWSWSWNESPRGYDLISRKLLPQALGLRLQAGSPLPGAPWSHQPPALWPVSLVDGAWRWGCIVRSCTPAFTSWWQEGPPEVASF